MVNKIRIVNNYKNIILSCTEEETWCAEIYPIYIMIAHMQYVTQSVNTSGIYFASFECHLSKGAMSFLFVQKLFPLIWWAQSLLF